MIDPVSLNPTDTHGLLSAGKATPGGAAAGGGAAKGPAEAPGSSFAEFLYDRLDEVNRLQTEADAGVQRLLTGETDNVAEVFAAGNKAGIALIS